MEFKTINKYLENLVNALREENEANTEMLDNFYTYLETDDKKYLKLANNQLREILKGAGFGILLVLPFSPITCLLYTSPSPRDKRQSRMPSSA